FFFFFFFFSSRRRHTRFSRDWSSDVCSSDLWFIFWLIALPISQTHMPNMKITIHARKKKCKNGLLPTILLLKVLSINTQTNKQSRKGKEFMNKFVLPVTLQTVEGVLVLT